MKLTKFQHACFALENGHTTIVVDPGVFSHDFIIPKHVDAIIVTHEHPDHIDMSLMQRIIEENPHVTIIAHETITTRFTNTTTIAAKPGETYPVGEISLQFFGGVHAPIAEGIITPPNLGVLINETLYYPGDSFTIPTTPSGETIKVTTLALPVSAPWLNVSQVRNFLTAVHPVLTFPTHDGILSEDGKQLAENLVGGFAQSQGIIYKRLDGESIELS